MNIKSKVLVTGANGLLGTNTIIELLNQGYAVVGFLRDKYSFVGEKHENLELVEGNILNSKDLANALRDCAYVVHTAALTDPGFFSYEPYKKININGTKNVVDSAINAKIKKLIYVGTANVHGFGPLNNLGNESKQIMEPFSKLYYSLSKKAAQEYVLSMKNKIDITVVNPSFMIGAYDSKPSSGRIILIGLKKRFLLCPPGGKSFICVNDVSKGIVKALECGVNGETYLLSNANMNYKTFFNLVKDKTGSSTVIIPVPKFFLLLLGYIGSFIRGFGINTQFSIENMKALCVYGYYSNEKAKIHLGVSFNPIESGIEDCLDWFKKNNNYHLKYSKK